MQRLFSPFALVALVVLASAGALMGLAGFACAALWVLAVAVLRAVSASGGNPMPARRLPHWLDVALYRGLAFGSRCRDKLGALHFAWQVRTGAVLCMAFPSAVTTDLAFGVVGELANDGPYRSTVARISHATAADIVIGRWFTLAADGTARPGGTGAIGGVLTAPKTQASFGTAANGSLAPTQVLATGTIAEFVYMGAVIIAAPAAVALDSVAKYDTTTGVIGVGAPGAGEAAIPNAKFKRVVNAAAALAVLELTN